MSATGYRGAFFIKEGPGEVDFDMERVFLRSSVVGGTDALRSDGIEGLLDEKLLKLDDSLRERHAELVSYLREVDVRISRVEDEIRSGLEFSQELSRSSLKTAESMASFDWASTKSENELGEVPLRKESSLPNIAIDQEELDALLEGLNDISKDGRETLSGNELSGNELEKGLNRDGSVEELFDMKFDRLGVEDACNGSLEESTACVDTEEGVGHLGVNFDVKSEESLLDEVSSFGLTSVAENDADLDIGINSDVVSSVSEKAVGNQEDSAGGLDCYPGEGVGEEMVFSDSDLKLLNNEKHKGGEQEAIFDGACDGIADCDSTLNVRDESALVQEQKVGAPADFKELDDFEDVLKADLDCSDLQGCIGDFEEKNLYNNSQSESLGAGEKLRQNEGGDLSGFNFTEVEKVINKFDDDAYLSKLELSSEEREVLVRFINKLGGDIEVDSRKGSSFKSRREYEILQKIKRLLIRE
ncbi:hypothetical protein LKV13_03835 [Borrelia sp. BU AG58]|uniref:hypothetical protein n=1 Tax=Borrelia sp. BU AG58 TaxID=2887345 RepID=UPI001E4862EE|nr:hypothetical protein [Borrelia sp. BU AG58]UER67892.1 hypothetical protein LKV13_03835 [Borrelia sp. BU AG58]